VIQPPPMLFSSNIDYTVNGLGEKGEPVPSGFGYESGTNERFLSIPEIDALHAALEPV
jgi:UDP-N-acetylglucosamine 4,6-dehydratase